MPRTPYPARDDVRGMIAARGWTLADAARAVGRHPRHLRSVLRGAYAMSAPLADDLSRLLGEPIEPTPRDEGVAADA